MGPTPPAGTWRRAVRAWRGRRRSLAAERDELALTVDRLRREKAFQDQLLNATPMIILRPAGQAEGRILYASAHAEQLLGHPVDEAHGVDVLRSRVHPDDVVRLARAVAELDAGAPRAQVDVRFRTKDGAYRWASVLAVAGHDEEGTPGALVAYAFDVDDRRRADESARDLERKLAAVFAVSPDVIVIIDAGGRIETISPAIERVLGMRPEQLVGQRATDLIHPDDRAAVAAEMARLGRGEATSVAVRYRTRHADGHDVVFESSCTFLSHRDGSGAVVVVGRDVTERARLEQAQHEARLAAEAANRSKSEFLSRMSHELRTPLNAVLGFAQLLELENLSDSERECTEQILWGGRHLLDLIDEVLDISRIETGRLAMWPEPIRLGDVVDEAVELVRPLAAPSSVALVNSSAGCGCWVLADRQRLKQVLLNLLSNAVKYNRVEGSVTLTCDHRGPPGPGGSVRLHVADTGRGIRPEHLDLLFTPFERLEATQTTIEGAGLGLALSQRLAEAMGGSISAESSYGQGSTFTLTLCPAEPSAPAPAPV